MPPSIISALPLAALLATALPGCVHVRTDRFTERAGDREIPLIVRHGPEDELAARQVRRALAVALPRAERWGRLAGPLTVTIHPTHAALEAAANRPAHAWLRAWSRPFAIELQSPRTWSRGAASDEQLAQLLTHELTHCVMYQAVGSDARIARSIPVWFREGMATTSAGERWAGVRPASGSGAGLADAAAAFRDDSLRLYASADRAFRSLLDGFGELRVLAILASLRGGAAFDEAFRGATGVSVDAFEAELRTGPPPTSG